MNFVIERSAALQIGQAELDYGSSSDFYLWCELG
jgi:hypothetical protein